MKNFYRGYIFVIMLCFSFQANGTTSTPINVTFAGNEITNEAIQLFVFDSDKNVVSELIPNSCANTSIDYDINVNIPGSISTHGCTKISVDANYLGNQTAAWCWSTGTRLSLNFTASPGSTAKTMLFLDSGADWCGLCEGMAKLKKLDGSNLDMENYYDYDTGPTPITSLENFFSCCSNVEWIKLNKPSNATNFNYMFEGCHNLKTLKVADWPSMDDCSIQSVFDGCSADCKNKTYSELGMTVPQKLRAYGITEESPWHLIYKVEGSGGGGETTSFERHSALSSADYPKFYAITTQTSGGAGGSSSGYIDNEGDPFSSSLGGFMEENARRYSNLCGTVSGGDSGGDTTDYSNIFSEKEEGAQAGDAVYLGGIVGPGALVISSSEANTIAADLMTTTRSGFTPASSVTFSGDIIFSGNNRGLSGRPVIIGSGVATFLSENSLPGTALTVNDGASVEISDSTNILRKRALPLRSIPVSALGVSEPTDRTDYSVCHDLNLKSKATLNSTKRLVLLDGATLAFGKK